MVRIALVVGLCLLVSPVAAEEADLERLLLRGPNARLLRAWHDRFCQEPHPAGSEADRRMADTLATAFEELGVEVERHDFYPYLPEFVSAQVEVIQGDQRESLRLNERAVDGDPWVKDDGPIAWNAYSGSGDVTASVLYANYGTKEDFEQLSKLGVDPKGKIVIARYGKNYRGYKAKYAEAAGAVGLLMYTDPADSGYAQGAMYPEGGYANPSAIQRGSIKTLAYAGDPLTPGKPATKDANRLDPDAVALPRIPVQPLGWEAASKVLGAMRGALAPKGWQGGLPFAYRLSRGPAPLQVRMKIEQKRSIRECTNVIGKLEGTSSEAVVVGCHYDAWTFGAGDPHAGTIVLYEMARSFAEAVKHSGKLRRTIYFANWAAEEYGIIGSTEWVEERIPDIEVVAYINLDMAAMGTQFRSSADPLLKDVIEAVAARVPQADRLNPTATATATVADAWRARSKGVAKFGVLGGGSDHVAFYCHAGIPSCTLGAGGSKGVSYHSSYDNLAWYRKVVGNDYEGARMVAQVGNLLLHRLADDPVLPYGPRRVASFLREQLADLDARATAAGLPRASKDLASVVTDLEARAQDFETDVRRSRPQDAGRMNEALIGLRRAFLANRKGPRPWYRNLLAAPDPTSGYAAWPLPRIRGAIEAGSAEDLATTTDELLAAIVNAMSEVLSRRR